MRRLSSRYTYFYKRVFPLLWFGILTVVALGVGLSLLASRQSVLPFLIMPIFMAALGFVLYRKLIADLVDEVWLAGDVLLVKNRGDEISVGLRDVMNVNAVTMMNPRRITLMLRNDTRFGQHINFMPAIQSASFVSSFKPDPIATELIERVDALRMSTR
ncbi:hypothetical protein [Dyella psychrodurans]|uniref:PH domain-containing protein n=1 Tax=Dyella psychrodurans TaxID=1927960 RepID=A0A370X4W7_9GAMM|nr:hypothetical protein [Dyella psychrodurans]RDS83310.1 hypothetical protein DWU99_12255 [Dyella psychrodurans]